VTFAARPRFASTSPFHAELKRRVEAHFAQAGISPEGGGAIFLKVAVMFAWLSSSYALALWGDVAGWQAALLACSVGLAVAGIGFTVMHDAVHDSATSSPRWNRLLGFSGDVNGASAHVWRQRHNVLHHTYTNIARVDDDLEGGPLLRLAPWQPRHPLHRFQHLYVWFLYALFPLRWWLFDDFLIVFRGRIGAQPIPRPKGWALAAFLGGKVTFLAWAFVIPAFTHPTAWLIPLWLLAIGTTGLTLAVFFQLAHCVGEAGFIDPASGVLPCDDWARHQVSTTVDFARENRLLTWYVGGLNYQIEHHLFPRVSHVHYPALARLVEQTCREHAVPYRAAPTLFAALRSNVMWLRRMGTGDQTLSGP
jgi:linoleoyl-CoA desaturase